MHSMPNRTRPLLGILEDFPFDYAQVGSGEVGTTGVMTKLLKSKWRGRRLHKTLL